MWDFIMESILKFAAMFIDVKKNKYFVSKNDENSILNEYTEHIHQLWIIILKSKNTLCAETITYSFKYKKKKNVLDIRIKIYGIKNNINKHKLFFIGAPHNIRDPELKLSGVGIPLTITPQGSFVALTFDFTNFNTKGKDIEINFKYTAINKNHRAYLYFIPKNYLKQVNTIKIKHGNKGVSMFLCNGNSGFDSPVSLEPKTRNIVLDTHQNPNYVDSIFFIKNFKDTEL